LLVLPGVFQKILLASMVTDVWFHKIMIILKYVSNKWLLFHLAVVLSIIIEGGIFKVHADEDAGSLINYSFAVWAGSGVYKVSDANKRFAVLRVPAAYTLRPARYDKPVFRDTLGFRLLLPAIITFEDETYTNLQFGTGAFVPGLEMQIPVNKYWTLKLFGQVGAGKDTAGGDLRYIYGGGAKSIISLTWEKFVFGIGNSLILAEERNATEDEHSGFSMLEAGLDIRHPIGLTFRNRELDASIFFVASHFFDRVDFLEDDGSTERVNKIYTFGLTLGTDEPVSIWKVNLDRIGIDYRFGDNGFSGIGFNLGFPF
jgi:hypothetical protein